jgi:hypothetical protein
MNVIASDTSSDAMLEQCKILRRMGIKGRAAMTFELSNSVRQITESGVRHRHADYTQEQVRREVVRLMIGEPLFREIFGDGDTERPR